MGIEYEEMVRRVKAKDPVAKKERQDAKAAMYGLPGGLGAETMVTYAKGMGTIITMDQAKGLIRDWRAAFPEMTPYFKWVDKQVQKGTIKSFRSDRIRGGITYCSGANNGFQGLVGDGGTAALYAVSRECYTDKESPLYGSIPVLFIHDEIILESPVNRAAEAAERLGEVMVREMKVYCPDVPIEAEASLMTRWYKDAEPRYEGGRLVPWK